MKWLIFEDADAEYDDEDADADDEDKGDDAEGEDCLIWIWNWNPSCRVFSSPPSLPSHNSHLITVVVINHSCLTIVIVIRDACNLRNGVRG